MSLAATRHGTLRSSRAEHAGLDGQQRDGPHGAGLLQRKCIYNSVTSQYNTKAERESQPEAEPRDAHKGHAVPKEANSPALRCTFRPAPPPRARERVSLSPEQEPHTAMGGGAPPVSGCRLRTQPGLPGVTWAHDEGQVARTAVREGQCRLADGHSRARAREEPRQMEHCSRGCERANTETETPPSGSTHAPLTTEKSTGLKAGWPASAVTTRLITLHALFLNS